MNNHDILITLLIIIIVAIQILVFFSVFRRIKLFREIFPNVQSFRTVRVYVPLKRIADITPEEILANLPKYSDSTNEEPYSNIQHADDDGLFQQEIDFDLDAEEADGIWMSRGSEEKKVPNHLVSDYASNGWVELIEPDEE